MSETNILDNPSTTTSISNLITDNERIKNLQRIQFQKPQVKSIISYHSGSLLAIPVLSSDKKSSCLLSIENHEKIINKVKTITCPLLKEQIPNILSELKEFPYYNYQITSTSSKSQMDIMLDNISNDIINRFFVNSNDEITLDKLLQFIEEFYMNATDYGQRYRLYAGRGNIQEMAELLLRGCDINASNGDGLSALHYAAERNQVDIIDLLIAFRKYSPLAINQQDRYGFSALHTACYYGHPDCVRKLIEYGIDMNLVDNYGKTCLHIASTFGKISVLTVLLELDASLNNNKLINCTCHHKMTALHDAAMKGQDNAYHLLKNHPNIDTSIVDVLGHTAVELL